MNEHGPISIFNDYQDGESRLLRVIKSAIPGTDDNGIVVQTQVLRPEPIGELPVRPMQHEVKDTQSFLDWLKFTGAKKENTLICWNDILMTIKAVLNTDAETAIPDEDDAATDDVLYGTLPNCIYNITLHRFYEIWKKEFRTHFTHKALIQFLLRNQADIKDASEFIQAWKQIKTAMNIDVDAQYSDGHKMLVNFESDVKSGTQTAELPRYFVLRLPVLASDDEPIEFVVDVEIGYPERASDKPTFHFFCRDFEDAVRVAMKREVNEIRKALDGFTILYGTL